MEDLPTERSRKNPKQILDVSFKKCDQETDKKEKKGSSTSTTSSSTRIGAVLGTTDATSPIPFLFSFLGTFINKSSLPYTEEKIPPDFFGHFAYKIIVFS